MHIFGPKSDVHEFEEYKGLSLTIFKNDAYDLLSHY